MNKYGISGKNIVLGVCGGIAAYKTVELMRLLQKDGAMIRVIMTRNALKFVGRMTFDALADFPVCWNLFEKSSDAPIQHIEWAQAADAAVVAPATANMIGKIANGIADDAVSTFLSAVTAPIMICPSMNTNMYLSAPVRRNIERLKSDGKIILEPDSGDLACGVTGPGRLPDPPIIRDRIHHLLSPKDLTGTTVLVTAGPTREHLDPVRYISNPSTGKMGFAIARAAEYRGAKVILVAGPTTLPPPVNVHYVPVKSAEEMADAVFGHMEQSDVIIKSAAVSDFRPLQTAREKVKKEAIGATTIELVRNPDILKELGRQKGSRVLVGFAAETEELEKNAQLKLEKKNLDIIAGNIVSKDAHSGFGTDTNRATLFFRDGAREQIGLTEKGVVANILLDRIVEKFLRKGS